MVRLVRLPDSWERWDEMMMDLVMESGTVVDKAMSSSGRHCGNCADWRQRAVLSVGP